MYSHILNITQLLQSGGSTPGFGFRKAEALEPLLLCVSLVLLSHCILLFSVGSLILSILLRKIYAMCYARLPGDTEV